MLEFDAIIIRRTPFRDQDAVINTISKDGLRSFLAKGVLKIESKNSSSVTPYVKSKLCLFKGKDGYFLRQGTLLEAYAETKKDLINLSVLDFVGEVTNQLVRADDGDKVYPVLEKILNELNKGFDPLSAALIYLAQVLNLIGYGLEVDKCSVCGKINPLVDVSYTNGGFICRDCLHGLKEDEVMPRKLKILRYIFRVSLEHIGEISFNKDENCLLLIELSKFVLNVTDIELKSVNLLTKI